MTYKIKSEYIDLWFCNESSPDPDYIVTDAELQRLAQEWDRPVEELKEQLIPQE